MTAVMAGIIPAPARPDITAPRSARLKPRELRSGAWYGLCEDCAWDTRQLATGGTYPSAGCVAPIAGQHGGIDRPDDVPMCTERIRIVS